jgi:arylsulfatase A-like enzyme
MNVILLVNDSFRRDHLGCYGNPCIRTPNLDQFAQHAAVFEQCYIASYPTVPHRWDLSTGRFGFPFRGWQPLGASDVTLAQVLSQHGMHTQMIWDTPMLAADDYNYTRGFNGVYFVHGQKGDPWITNPSLPIRMPAQPHKIKSPSSLATYLRNHFQRQHERQYCVARTLTAAKEWLEVNYQHESFLLYVDMWDPHEPFDCPWYDHALYADPEYRGDLMLYPQYGRPTYMTEEEHANARALYAGNVTLVDRWVGDFLDMAERLGLFSNTLIIWTTDHGHLFGEHGLQGKPGATLGMLYEVTTRIPLLVHHPEGLGAGSRARGIVQPPDIFRSILDLLGIRCPPGVQGRSFWPSVTGEGQSTHRYAFSSRFPPRAGDPTYAAVEGAAFDGWVGSGRTVEPSTVTSDEWAYICAPHGMPPELYDLKSDPGQERNVIDHHPQVAREMRTAWIDFLQSHGAPETRMRPFLEANVDVQVATGRQLFAFRDDRGQWIAFSTEREARAWAYRCDSPGEPRDVERTTFGALLDDNPKNLIHLFDQYYWAQDLA